MSYRKLSADRLFTGLNWLDDQHVLLVTEGGTIEGIVPIAEAGEGVERLNGIISPGFVNCHCHLELSHMKGMIAQGTGMVPFINTVMNSRQAREEIISEAIEAAEAEMLQNGIVACGDICNTAASLHQKTLGRIYYHNFIELSGFVPGSASERFNQGLELFNLFAQQYSLAIESNSIVPHAPYSVSTELLKKIVGFPGNHLLTMHNQESIAENEFFLYKGGDFLSLYKGLGIDLSFWTAPGKSGLLSVLPHFFRNQSLILVHNVHLSANDIRFIFESKNIRPQQVFICLCPNANLFIGNGLPDIDLMLKTQLPIVLGTDSLASNTQLSIWDEIKTLQRSFPCLSIEQVLPWATINGARALDMDGILGSFEKGKRPGVVVIEGGEARRLE